MLCELRRLLILMCVHLSVVGDLSFWEPVSFSKLSHLGKEGTAALTHKRSKLV